MKPLSETELREKIDDYVDRFRMQWVVEGDEYHQSELIEDIVQLIIQDRKAWGEHNSKSAEAVNYMISVWDEVTPPDAPDTTDQTPKEPIVLSKVRTVREKVEPIETPKEKLARKIAESN